MPQQTFDRSTKWLIEEQGTGVLVVAGEPAVLSCRALQAEVVQPRKLPDGLIEARFRNESEPTLFLVEVATYPEKRVPRQVHDDVMLVRQARGVLPETVVLVLRQRGRYRVPTEHSEKSRRGWTTAGITWRVVELWTLSAEELLASPNVGVIPWAPLARYDGSPEVLLRRCRDRIDQEGGARRADLLAVSQVFARLNFDRPEWLEILGGTKAMIESPLIQEIVTESQRAERVKTTLEFLEARFGAVPPTITAGLQEVKGQDRLERLTRQAALCASLQAFEEAMRQELSTPAPVSTRGKRRSRKTPE